MKRFKECVIAILICLLSKTLPISSKQHRSRRFLTFPLVEPTCIQFIAGVGIPVDLKIEAITIGYVFKMQFFLPTNASDFLDAIDDPFNVSPQPLTGLTSDRRRSIDDSNPNAQSLIELVNDSVSGPETGYDYEQNERFERYQTEAEVVQNGTESASIETEDFIDNEEIIDNGLWLDTANDNNDDTRVLKGSPYLGTSRFSLYKGIVAVAESKGLSGKACVLRSICESAHTTYDDSNGILSEIMHVIMTPSSTQDEVTDYTDYEYYRAEKLGKDGAPCEHIFNDCNISILDLFTGTYSAAEDLFNLITN